MKLRRWVKLLLTLAVLFIAACAVGAFILFRPWPAPQVALSFQGFKVDGTNAQALIALKNNGSHQVWWGYHFTLDPGKPGEPRDVFPRMMTPNGRPRRVDPGSEMVTAIPMSGAFTNWRISTVYFYYPRFPARRFFDEHFGDWAEVGGVRRRYYKGVYWSGVWLCKHIAEPQPISRSVSTDILTNQPPPGSSSH